MKNRRLRRVLSSGGYIFHVPTRGADLRPRCGDGALSVKEVPISRLLVPSGLSLGAGILVSLALGVFSRLASSQAQWLITPLGSTVLGLGMLGLCVIAGVLGWKYADGGRRWSLAGAIAASVTFGANAALLPTLKRSDAGPKRRGSRRSWALDFLSCAPSHTSVAAAGIVRCRGKCHSHSSLPLDLGGTAGTERV